MRVVLVTIPQGKGAELAQVLMSQAVCACVNILPGVQSFYLEDGVAKQSSEELLVIKVSEADIGILRSTVIENHPYHTPEFVALDVDLDKSDDDYVRWVQSATRM